MAGFEQDTWIKRGRWRVNVARGLAAHDGDGCVFRVIRDPSAAFWIEANGSPPPLDQIATMQSRAFAVFWLIEKLLTRRSAR
jgi:hypothetical protein